MTRLMFPAAVLLAFIAGAGSACGFRDVCVIAVAFAIVAFGAWLRVLVRE